MIDERLLNEDKDLIAQFKKGDEKALSHFFKLHYRTLCYFVTKMLQDESEAEDTVATAFVKLWERRENFDSPQSIKSFLFITCRNASLNFLKKSKRASLHQQEYIYYLDNLDSEVMNHVVESEFLNTLYHEVSQLPEQCRRVFFMLYFDGKKTDEIALEMDLSVKTVRNHKSRALETLHNAFLKRGVSDALSFLVFLYL